MLISFHTHILPGSFTHSHEELEITYCPVGSHIFHYTLPSGEQQLQEVEQNMLIFMPRNIPHGIISVKYPYHRFFVSISRKEVVDWLDDPALLSPFQAQFIHANGDKGPVPTFLHAGKSKDAVESILARMQEVQIYADAANEHEADFHARCLFGLLFCELRRHHPDFFSRSPTLRNHMVADIRAFIDENYEQTLSIQDIARKYFVHPSYLTHCFTAQMGISPRKYLTNLRLANARKLLESSDDSVQDIALQVGFGNVNNFIQSFRARYDITPLCYRKKATTEITG